MLSVTCLLVLFFGMSCLSSCVLSTTTESGPQVTSENDLYTEAPCELRALSGYKDIQGNIWGIGSGNLWWFNSTNLSWSLLPLPNGTASSSPWRVACGDPKLYVALIGKNASLVLHLPWQHWQIVDTDDVSLGYIDKDAFWCVNGNLYAVDPLRETLYVLDSEEARWTVTEDITNSNSVNWSKPLGVVNTWLGDDHELVMVEKFGLYTRVMYTNESGIDWITVAFDNLTTLWPDLNKSERGLSVSWKLWSENLWLWLDDREITELWAFNFNTTKWRRGNRKFIRKLPSLRTVLTGWVEDDQYCVLIRSQECNAQYSLSHTDCWLESKMLMDDDQDSNEDPVMPLITASTLDNLKEAHFFNEKGSSNHTSSTRVISPPVTTVELPTSPQTKVIDISKYIKPVVTKYTPDIDWKAREIHDSEMVDISPARGLAWHQHTSVFGSIIFFGTSLTIFGLVGFFWCVRKCVHFPKEALLLRDPPSVRYTAIPDALGFNVRKPTPAAYTVIPDSIA